MLVLYCFARTGDVEDGDAAGSEGHAEADEVAGLADAMESMPEEHVGGDALEVDEGAGGTATPTEVAGEAIEEGEEEAEGASEGIATTFWMPMWVKVDAYGNIVSPLHMASSVPTGGIAFAGAPTAPRGALPKAPAHAGMAKAPFAPTSAAPTQAAATPATPQVGTAPAPPQAAAAPTPPQAHATPQAMMDPFIKSFESMAKSLERAMSGRSQALAKVDEEEKLVELKIKEEVTAWQLVNRKKTVKRMKWPFERNNDIDLSDFKEYLEGPLQQAEASVGQNIRLLRGVYGLFDLPQGFQEQQSFWCTIYKTGKATTLQGLHIMNSKLPHTCNLATSLSHYLEFLVRGAERNQHADALRCFVGLQKEFLQPMQKKVAKAKKARKTANKAEAAKRLKHLPPVDILQGGIKDTMVCLEWARRTVEMVRSKGEPVEWQIKYVANSLMAGLIFGNSYAGRPGEWAALTRAVVEEVLATGADWVLMADHKTVDVHGEAGRPLPRGNLKAMHALVAIHEADEALFLAPAKALVKGKFSSIDKLLKKWSGHFFPKYTQVGATLQRKLVHTRTNQSDVAEKMFDMVCGTDKHRTKTGRDDYDCTEPEEEAANGLIMYRAVVADPVDWPSEEDILAGKDKAFKSLHVLCFRSTKDKDGEEEGAGEDAEEEGEGDDEGEDNESDGNDHDEGEEEEGEEGCEDEEEEEGEGDDEEGYGSEGGKERAVQLATALEEAKNLGVMVSAQGDRRDDDAAGSGFPLSQELQEVLDDSGMAHPAKKKDAKPKQGKEDRPQKQRKEDKPKKEKKEDRPKKQRKEEKADEAKQVGKKRAAEGSGQENHPAKVHKPEAPTEAVPFATGGITPDIKAFVLDQHSAQLKKEGKAECEMAKEPWFRAMVVVCKQPGMMLANLPDLTPEDLKAIIKEGLRAAKAQDDKEEEVKEEEVFKRSRNKIDEGSWLSG